MFNMEKRYRNKIIIIIIIIIIWHFKVQNTVKNQYNEWSSNSVRGQ